MTGLLNLGAGLLVFFALVPSYLTAEELGVVRLWGRTDWRWWAVGIGVALLGVIVAGSSVDALRRRFADRRYADWNTWQIPIKVLLILVATATFEEFLFRGVIVAVWDQAFSTDAAIAGSSVAFGLWHIGAELERVRANRDKAPRTGRSVLLAVAFTSLAGAFLAIVRLASGSIWPGVIIHATVNVWSFLVAVRAGRRASRFESR